VHQMCPQATKAHQNNNGTGLSEQVPPTVPKTHYTGLSTLCQEVKVFYLCYV